MTHGFQNVPIQRLSQRIVSIQEFSGISSTASQVGYGSGGRCLLPAHECKTWFHAPGGPLSDVFSAKERECWE